MASKENESVRAGRMFKRLGLTAPRPAAQQPQQRQQRQPLQPAVTNDEDAASVVSFTPSDIEALNPEWVANWAGSCAPLPPPSPETSRKRPPGFKRKRPMVPSAKKEETRAAVSPQITTSGSCLSVQLNVTSTPGQQSPNVNVAVHVPTPVQQDVTSTPGQQSPKVNVAVHVPTPVQQVVRQLFEAREKIHQQRNQQDQDESEEDDGTNSIGSSYSPSQSQADSSDSNAEVEEDFEQEGSEVDTPQQPQDFEQEGSEVHTPQQPTDQQTSDEEISPPSKTRKKRRIRQTTSSTRRQRQVARNTGQAYKTSSGKQILAKKSEPLPDCKKKCSSRISDEQSSQICEEFWGLGKVSLRRTYVSNLIEVDQKATQRLRFAVSPSKRRNRKLTMQYHLVLNGKNEPVCRGCFMKVLRVTPKFIHSLVQKKMKTLSGVMPSEEARGRSSSGLSSDRIDSVREHLNSFPRYKSHYAREKTDKMFLPNTLTIKKMYDEYLMKYPLDHVSRWTYEREFHAMNLSIKPLKIDTCNKCDRLQKAVMYAATAEEKAAAKRQQELHHRKAEKARAEKRADIEELKTAPNKRVIAFDLQQCLPTPFLQTSVAFYARQLWVYNLTIHDCGTGKSVHCMWHEGEAERGSNEVGSALKKYLKEDIPADVTEVTLWSDTCGGQNKNSTINAVLQTVISERPELVINQKFLVSGHTFLDCDTDHSVIERKKKNAENIHLPRDWYSLVRNASPKFSVTLMDRSRQYNFKSLLKGRESPLVKRKKNTENQKFEWKNVVWLQHSQRHTVGTVAYKKTLDRDSLFQFLDMKRKKKGPLDLAVPLSFSGPRAIKQGKKDDLVNKLLPLIDPECRQFYLDLVGDKEDADTPQVDPDLLPSSSEEESGGED